MKTMKKEFWPTTFACFLPILAGIVLYPRLPETMATHWGIDGTANGWMPRPIAAIGLPALLLGIHFVAFCGDAKSGGEENRNTVLHMLCLWICPLVSLLCSTVTLGTALGYAMNVGVIVTLFIGLLFVILGNYLPKIRQNRTMGVRTPWTLKSEENWRHTHRVAGFSWVCGGFVLIAAALFRARTMSAAVIAAVLLAALPVAYSYCYYRRNERGEKNG